MAPRRSHHLPAIPDHMRHTGRQQRSVCHNHQSTIHRKTVSTAPGPVHQILNGHSNKPTDKLRERLQGAVFET
jgi:hypothetical protein